MHPAVVAPEQPSRRAGRSKRMCFAISASPSTGLQLAPRFVLRGKRKAEAQSRTVRVRWIMVSSLLISFL
jgi:hypothetical protein